MSAQQPPFGRCRDAVHAGQQLAGIVTAGGGGPLAAPVVEVAQLVDALITRPSVGDDRRADLDVIGDELMQPSWRSRPR